jgi:hypothetical protein
MGTYLQTMSIYIRSLEKHSGRHSIGMRTSKILHTVGKAWGVFIHDTITTCFKAACLQKIFKITFVVF